MRSHMLPLYLRHCKSQLHPIVLMLCTRQAAIIERLGAFKSIAKPGLTTYVPCVESVTARLSLKTLQLVVKCETKVCRAPTQQALRGSATPSSNSSFRPFNLACTRKTKDNVFVTVEISVQFRVVEANVKDAW